MVSAGRSSGVVYDNARSVLLFADRPSRRADLRDAIEALGARVVEAASIGDALPRLEARIALDAVVAEAEEASPALDALIARLNAAAEAGGHPSVLIVPPEMIDAAVAAAPHGDITLLCAPTVFERAAALAEALADRHVNLHDVSTESATPRLRQISEEVSRIAQLLAAMSGADGERKPPAPPRPELPAPARRAGDAVIDAMQVRAMIRARRLRELYFSADLFADPAWDMLLDLMAARLERRQVAVSSLCIAAAVPPTTALRWIKLLTDQGILIRVADPTDGRRVFIELAEQAVEGMMNYLAAAQRLATIAP